MNPLIEKSVKNGWIGEEKIEKEVNNILKNQTRYLTTQKKTNTNIIEKQIKKWQQEDLERPTKREKQRKETSRKRKEQVKYEKLILERAWKLNIKTSRSTNGDISLYTIEQISDMIEKYLAAAREQRAKQAAAAKRAAEAEAEREEATKKRGHEEEQRRQDKNTQDTKKPKDETWKKKVGNQLEDCVKDLFSKKGYTGITLNRKENEDADYAGVDITAFSPGKHQLKTGIQCKNHKKPIEDEEIKRLATLIDELKLEKLIIICTGGFTDKHRKWKELVKKLEYWDYGKLNAELEEYGMSKFKTTWET
jgi:hypothetical protein